MRSVLRRSAGAAAGIALLVACAASLPARAASPTDPVLLEPAIAEDGTPAAGPDIAFGRSVMVHLEGPSLAEVLRQAMPEGRAGAAPTVLGTDAVAMLHRGIIARQAPVAAAIEATGAAIVGRLQTTMNAIHVHASPEQQTAILRMPGVRGLTRAPIHTLDMDDSRPFLGIDRVNEELGFDGEGVTIAVIDTGIDYTHASFGGSGNVEEFNGNDPLFIEDGTFPTAKVVGGWDFVGEMYDAGCLPNNPECTDIPEPDEDQIPSHPHGTHVAGISAGIETDDVPAGAAPAATVVGLKVFSNGSTDVTTEAIEWVVNHNLYLDDPESELVPGTRPEGKIHVINMSLGASWGGGIPEYDAVTAAALDQGVTVVASAGNSGATPWIVGSPSASEMILSVANTFASGEYLNAMRADWEEAGEAKTLRADFATDDGWLPSLDDTGPISALSAWYGAACLDPETGAPVPPIQDVTEKIALVERGGCTFVEKITNAEAAGAIAVVVFTNENPKGGMGGDCEACPQIPAVIIDRAPGLQIRDLLVGGTDVTITLSNEERIEFPWLTDVVADSSSRGPSRAIAGIKPQIAAPGSNILAASMGTGSKGVRFSGTSMSGPLVAGITALLHERNASEGLELSADDIAALAMNYATPVITRGRNDTGPRVGVNRQGAGRVQAYASAVGDTLVRSDSGLAELSFGMFHLLDEDTEAERSFVVRNLGEADKTYAIDWSLAFPDEDADQGIDLALTPSDTLTVEAGSFEQVDALLSVAYDDLREWNLYSNAALADEAVFQNFEVDGYIRLTEVDGAGAPVEGGDVVGLPFHAVARNHACTVSDHDEPFELPTTDDSVEVTWENECSEAGLLRHYAALADDAAESVANEDMPAKLDARVVGIKHGTIQGQTGPVDLVVFAVSTEAMRRLPADADILIYTDADQDGEPEKIHFPAGAAGGRWVTVTAPPYVEDDEWTWEPNPDANSWVSSYLMVWDIDESVSALAVPLTSIAEGAAFANGGVTFDFGIAVRDGAGDFPETNAYDGEDLVPSDLHDGEWLTFDQDALDCVSATGPDGVDLLDINTVANVATNTSLTGTIGLACEIASDHAPIGILAQHIYNMQDERGWQLLSGVFGERPAEAVYLPWAVSNHDMNPMPTQDPNQPTPEEPTAIIEPTATSVPPGR